MAKTETLAELRKALLVDNQPRAIEERRTAILSLLEELEKAFSKAKEARVILRDLGEILTHLFTKSEEVGREREGLAKISMGNCDQGTALLEETVNTHQILVDALDQLLLWKPGKKCIECGEKIEAERLEIVPGANLCSNCAKAAVEKRRHR